MFITYSFSKYFSKYVVVYSYQRQKKGCTQVKIDGPVRARYFDGPLTGSELVTGPCPNWPVTGPCGHVNFYLCRVSIMFRTGFQIFFKTC